VTIVLVPVPAIDPGLIVHVPVAGSPDNSTLPVGAAHVEGWLLFPLPVLEAFLKEKVRQHWLMAKIYILWHW